MKVIKKYEIEYWQHAKSGEIYAIDHNRGMVAGPLHHSEIGQISEDDEKWTEEDWEWISTEPCNLYEI